MNSELDYLRASVRAAAADLGGPDLCRSLDPAGAGWDAGAWSVMAGQIGVSSLGLPESCGGLGGLAELAVVAEELGAALLPIPFLSTVLTAQVLVHAGGADDVITDIAEGRPAAFAGLDRRGWWSPDHEIFTATETTTGWSLTGHAPAVLGAADARWLVAVAHTSDGPDIFVVDAAATEPAITPLRTLDLSRAQAALTLSDTPARRLTVGGSASAAVDPALDVACIVLAAEQLGGAQVSLDRTAAYAKERRQFGRAIGSFQAVKHTLADMLVLVESSRSAVVRAIEATDLTEAGAVAQAWCSDAYRTVSAEAVQLHGGIGFTWEHHCHLYFRRARADAQLFGGAAFHRERLATSLAW
ncbi:acyl-CoA dehydrogenase [Rhodococcus sp. Leaf7]|uniref:acyl-CoA dehydrogenase family protein n=1 Tax=unclassified Rhodococcus (in: high G+C Gram-positive bacteria) TaxID=192944 RepID=UPI0006F34F26|nr:MULTISPECIES: acyl-CoA dehydrogenase family protein [unclassified Rhodococcus (in: high G+C Gram-positive bacteria)]KQU07176.1 acyl-CoA dehydrogenase [Rhodococcus sp. Leaf7]KQU42694.1 acyl-CoA dehydrogenase [Rhodococcus sp. Leaf247]